MEGNVHIHVYIHTERDRERIDRLVERARERDIDKVLKHPNNCVCTVL